MSRCSVWATPSLGPSRVVAGTAQPGDKATGRRRRGVVGVVDQLTYSLSSVVLTIAVAREVTVVEFGAFALAVLFGTAALSVLRGLTAETLAVRFTGAEPAQWATAARAALGFALVSSIVVAAPVGAIGALVSGVLGTTLLAVFASLPALVAQDFLRYAALSAGRPGLALLNDVVQLLLQVLFLVSLISAGLRTPWQLALAWGASALVAAILGGAMLRLGPSWRNAMRWYSQHGDLASRYGADNLIGQASQYSGAVVLGMIAPLSAVGAIRGANTLFAPPSVLAAGIKSAVVPEVVRGLRTNPTTFAREVRLISIGVAAVSGAWGAVVVLMPSGIGEALLGDTFVAVQPLLIYFAIAQVANGAWTGAMVGLRALGDGGGTVAARSIASSVAIGAQVAGALTGGAMGVAVATAIARPFQALTWWIFYARARRARLKGVPA